MFRGPNLENILIKPKQENNTNIPMSGNEPFRNKTLFCLRCPTTWPPRSPDLNPLDFYFWGHLKSLVYSTPINNVEDLRQRIIDCCNSIKQKPGIFERVRQSMRRRLECCIQIQGGHFEQLL